MNFLRANASRGTSWCRNRLLLGGFLRQSAKCALPHALRVFPPMLIKGQPAIHAHGAGRGGAHSKPRRCAGGWLRFGNCRRSRCYNDFCVSTFYVLFIHIVGRWSRNGWEKRKSSMHIIFCIFWLNRFPDALYLIYERYIVAHRAC